MWDIHFTSWILFSILKERERECFMVYSTEERFMILLSYCRKRSVRKWREIKDFTLGSVFTSAWSRGWKCYEKKGSFRMWMCPPLVESSQHHFLNSNLTRRATFVDNIGSTFTWDILTSLTHSSWPTKWFLLNLIVLIRQGFIVKWWDLRWC